MARTPRIPSSIRSQLRSAQNKANRDARKVTQDANRDFERRLNRAARKNNRDLEQRLRRATQAEPTAAEYGLLEELQATFDDDVDDERVLFLSYAHSDGGTVAGELHEGLTAAGVTVWYDQKEIKPGKSQALQMDRGLTHARGGVVLLTPAFLAGRFWTERELGVLLSKVTLVPVLHRVTFDEVKSYSAILSDLAGFTTAKNTTAEIAAMVAAAVLDEFPDIFA